MVVIRIEGEEVVKCEVFEYLYDTVNVRYNNGSVAGTKRVWKVKNRSGCVYLLTKIYICIVFRMIVLAAFLSALGLI